MNSTIQETLKFVTEHSKHKKFGVALFAINSKLENFKEVKNHYEKWFQAHNSEVMDEYHNAGVDIMAVNDIHSEKTLECVEFGFKCEFFTYNAKTGETISTAYHLCSRSSMAKKPFTAKVSPGIIDNNFRGDLKTYIKKDYDAESIIVEKYERLFQIVHPRMYPILAYLVDEKTLSKTKRGDGGFGSTGKGPKM